MTESLRSLVTNSERLIRVTGNANGGDRSNSFFTLLLKINSYLIIEINWLQDNRARMILVTGNNT